MDYSVRNIGKASPKHQAFRLSIAAIVTLISVQWQPGIIGQNFAPGLIIGAIALTPFIIPSKSPAPFDISLLIGLLAFPVYVFLLLWSSGFGEDAGKVIVVGVAHAMLLIAGVVKFGAQTLRRLFVLGMAWIVAILIITCVLRFGAITNQAPDRLVPIKHYETNALLYYPLALFYPQHYVIKGLSFMLPRAMGIFREPGLFQAFLCCAVLMVPAIAKGWRRAALITLLLSGVALCNSTAGYVSAALVIALLPFMLGLNSKIRMLGMAFLGLSASILLVMVVKDVEAVGIVSKLSGESGRDRIQAWYELKEYFAISPWLGFRHRADSELLTSQTGSILVFLTSYGVVGMLASLIPYVLLARRQWRSRAWIPLLPLFVTAATSQPLWATGPMLTLAVISIIADRDDVICARQLSSRVRPVKSLRAS